MNLVYRLSFIASILVLTLCNGAGETVISSCNSSPELCSLRFNQVSLAGSHNSGSGFDGSLRRCNGVLQDDCIWRNQNLNITGQLNLGIRFLEIDLCVLPDDCNSTVYDNPGNSTLFTCRYGIGRNSQNRRYAGPVNQIFQQVNDWMLENPNDVIGLYFPTNSPLGGSVTDIFSKLQAALEDNWLCDDSSSVVCMSTYYNTEGEWPTLTHAITTKQRIFIFVDPELSSDSNATLWNHHSFRSTYIEPTGEGNICDDRLLTSADLCSTREDILIQVGVTSGVCIDNGQDNCNRILPNATAKCYGLREDLKLTVNVVAVDFPERNTSTVFNIVKELNQQNIETYLVTTDPTTITSTVSTSITTTGNSNIAFGSLFVIITALVFVLYVL